MKKITLTLSLIAIGVAPVLTYGQAPGPKNRPKPPAPAEMAAQVVVDFDTDGTSALDATELEAALAFLHENRPPPPPHMEEKWADRPEPDHARRAGRMLEKFDADTDSQLSEAELTEAFSKMRKGKGKGKAPEGKKRKMDQ